MNTEQLVAAGYKIENAKIVSADFSMQDYGCLTFYMGIDSSSGYYKHGGYCLGHGYIGAENFEGSAKGLEYIMRIMDTVGVSKFSQLPDKYIRVAFKDQYDAPKIIGNIIIDQWFDTKEFFKNKEE